MRRSWTIPTLFLLALAMPLIILGELLGWSSQATGWPGLGILAFACWLHARMFSDEEAARECDVVTSHRRSAS